MVLTNFNAIKGANGRRYLALDMNVSKMNDFKYFDYIRDNCFNKEVGEAFFTYLYEIDTSSFNSLDIPITQAKRDLCADLISPLEKFLKFTYLLHNKNINMKVKELFQLYLEYANDGKHGAISPQQFCKQMRELGLNHYPSNGCNSYKIPVEDLAEIANRKKWLHELDKDMMVTDEDDDVVLRSVHNELQAEYNELKAKYDERFLSAKLEVQNVSKAITQVSMEAYIKLKNQFTELEKQNEYLANQNDMFKSNLKKPIEKKPSKTKVVNTENSSKETVILISDETINNVIQDLGFEDA
jgi:hypothetical protein